MKSVLFWIVVGVVVTFVSAEVIQNSPCNVGRDANIKSTSHEVIVDPCPEAADSEPCILYKGSNATITIRFTPTEGTNEKLKSTIAWVNGRTELNFRGMRPDACKYMTCPLVANQEVVFNATLTLSSTLPSNSYDLKVKIQEHRGRNKKVFACQLFSIKLADPVVPTQVPE